MSGGLLNLRPLASLSSGLLARKGQAKPAMRPQGFAGFGTAQDELGWNDMGFDGPRPAPEPPAVVRQRDDLETKLRAASEVRTPKAGARTKAGRRIEKAAFTLRLDEDRHLRLRLASAVSHRSSQQLLTQALDALLDDMPELEELVDRARASANGK